MLTVHFATSSATLLCRLCHLTGHFATSPATLLIGGECLPSSSLGCRNWIRRTQNTWRAFCYDPQCCAGKERNGKRRKANVWRVSTAVCPINWPCQLKWPPDSRLHLPHLSTTSRSWLLEGLLEKTAVSSVSSQVFLVFSMCFQLGQCRKIGFRGLSPCTQDWLWPTRHSHTGK